MTRFLNRGTQAFLDLVVLSVALWAAFYLRFDGNPPFLMIKRVVVLWPWVIALQYGTLLILGIHRFSWRFIGLRDVTRIVLALGASSIVLLAVRLAAVPLQQISDYFLYTLIPIGVLVIDFLLCLLGIVGVRALRRISSEHRATRERVKTNVGPIVSEATIVIGAGQAGLLVAKELALFPELGMRVVAFLDDDPLKVGTTVHGIPVVASTQEMERVVRERGATQALIAIASARTRDVRRLGKQCRSLGLATKIIPTVHDIVGGNINLGEIRELSIEDLLRRDPVQLEKDNISAFINNRTVVVSGAGGSIGSELCRQVCGFSPKRLILIERAENALFEAHCMLIAKFPDVEILPCIADVGDAQRIRSLFAAQQPSLVFHAAAHKHVPMMEENPGEAVKNNIWGTKTLAEISHESGVEAFVMVSTDKAVNPTSVMGVSKRIAEMYVQALAAQSTTRYVTVRFGNVLGSAGSVIPIFKAQIAAGGPVTVTDSQMTRYFMTIPEACQLILQAGTMGDGGEIFILDMGSPVRILDLARDLISLSGFEPEVDIDIEFCGIRPGEKLYEELSMETEDAQKTRHPKIFVGNQAPQDLVSLIARIEALVDMAHSEPQRIRESLAELVPEYSGAALERSEETAASNPGFVDASSHPVARQVSA